MDSRAALLNARPALRRALALLAPLLLATLVAGAAALAHSLLAARAERIAEARERLGTLRLLIAADPGPEAAAPQGAEFLPEGSLSLVQAAFQSRLGEIAAASGAELLAAGPLPVAERDGARFAGLRASLTGTNPQIVETIFGIESAVPHLTIRTARIEAATRAEAGAGDPVRLTLQVEIEGALPPGGEGSP